MPRKPEYADPAFAAEMAALAAARRERFLARGAGTGKPYDFAFHDELPDERPWRCTRCGSETREIVPSMDAKDGGNRLAAIPTQIDPRFAGRWCPYCRDVTESVRAATVREATEHLDRKPAPPVDARQEKGGW